MIGKIVVKAGDMLCRHRTTWLGRKLVHLIRVLYFKSENDNYNLHANGEGRVIDILARFNLGTFFDVGANHGEWSVAVRTANPNGQIFAFEASPITFVLLQQNLKNYPGIMVINIGLFDREGSLDFFQNQDDGLSSLIPSERNSNAVHLTVQLTTLDKFLADQGISHVGFLKIDTEGADYAILRGATETLRHGKVDVIQFEYGFVSVDTGNLLKQHYLLLEDLGYVLGKIYPRSVEFSGYHQGMENFIGPNFLAVRKERADIIQALR